MTFLIRLNHSDQRIGAHKYMSHSSLSHLSHYFQKDYLQTLLPLTLPPNSRPSLQIEPMKSTNSNENKTILDFLCWLPRFTKIIYIIESLLTICSNSSASSLQSNCFLAVIQAGSLMISVKSSYSCGYASPNMISCRLLPRK